MIATVKNTLDNENGFIMVLVVLMLAIVTVIGIAATRTSDTEMQIAANERSRVNEFYGAEGGLIDLMERPTSDLPAAIWNPASAGGWMSDAFLSSGTGATFAANADLDGDGSADTRVEVRCIENTGTAVGGLSTAANSIPLQAHIGPPPAGSGYSVKYFEVRRYAITSTSSSGNTELQTGVWKVFNKF